MSFPSSLTGYAHRCVLRCCPLVVRDSYYGCVRRGDGHDAISAGPTVRRLLICLVWAGRIVALVQRETVLAGRTVALVQRETVLAHGRYVYSFYSAWALRGVQAEIRSPQWLRRFSLLFPHPYKVWCARFGPVLW